MGIAAVSWAVLSLAIVVMAAFGVRHMVLTVSRLAGPQRHPYIGIERAPWPQITVFIGADLYDSAKAKLEEIAHARGLEARLNILSDAAMAPGNCRIEWAEGGVVRDRDATLRAIEEAVNRYIAARGAPRS